MFDLMLMTLEIAIVCYQLSGFYFKYAINRHFQLLIVGLNFSKIIIELIQTSYANKEDLVFPCYIVFV